MKSTILLLIIATTAVTATTNIQRDYDKIGCYQEYRARREDLIINDRSNIDWKNFGPYLQGLAYRCDKKTREANEKKRKGKELYAGFALHFYGECYGRTAAHINNLQNREKQKHLCDGGQDYQCSEGSEIECTGKENAEYVYKFKIKAPENIDGGYSEWGQWTKCQSKCGPGLKFRERTCTNPEPKGNGKDCTSIGDGTESQECTSKPCPVDGNWGDWGEFNRCNASCGGGTQVRHRSCINPSPGYGGIPCDGLSTESQDCNTEPCPVHGGWSSWSEYSECSKKCGGGTQSRTRGCTKPAPQYGGEDCTGQPVQSRSCNKSPCPVEGGYTSWTRYGKCTKKCGGGRQYRSRTCTNPRPAHDGRDCRVLGPATEMRACNKHTCIAKEYTKNCCEGKSLTMQCSGSRRLKIHYATYGRKSRNICKNWLSWAMRTNCRAGNSTNKVRQACEGRRSCMVRAINSMFGDPCWGTRKYLQVTYSCPE